jgi:hypothetical protein
MSSTTRTTLHQALCSSSILLLLSLLSLICIPLTTTMVKTQAVNATEVAYVLSDFMGVHTESQLLPEILRSKGIIDVDGIASMSFAIIDKLTYKDSDDNSTQPLNSGEKQLLKMSIVYTHRLSDDDTLLEYWSIPRWIPRHSAKSECPKIHTHASAACIATQTTKTRSPPRPRQRPQTPPAPPIHRKSHQHLQQEHHPTL